MTRASESAGLLMYRRTAAGVEVYIAHPGGPFWARRDDGAWSLPKGEVVPGEELLATAIRELEEETGVVAEGPFVALGSVRQKNGKIVHGWAFAGDLAPGYAIRSNTFEIEWPPRSGRRQEFPEIDRAEFVDPDTARRKLNPAQSAFVDRLLEALTTG